MKYWTRKHGSQRASAEHKVSVLQPGDLRNDGATYEPILWIRVEDTWHAIRFENEGEAKVLLSTAQHIYRGITK